MNLSFLPLHFENNGLKTDFGAGCFTRCYRSGLRAKDRAGEEREKLSKFEIFKTASKSIDEVAVVMYNVPKVVNWLITKGYSVIDSSISRLESICHESNLVTIFGYKCQFSFDEFSMATRGFWLCKDCSCMFYEVAHSLHFYPCVGETEEKKKQKENRFIFVVGPNWKASTFECKNPQMIWDSETQRIKTEILRIQSSQTKVVKKTLDNASSLIEENACMVPGYVMDFSYCKNYISEKGYWVCRHCKTSMLDPLPPSRCSNQNCEANSPSKETRGLSRFILVIGPNWHAQYNKIVPNALGSLELEEFWKPETKRVLNELLVAKTQRQMEMMRLSAASQKEDTSSNNPQYMATLGPKLLLQQKVVSHKKSQTTRRH